MAMEEHGKCDGHPKVGAVIAKKGVLLSTGYRGEQGRLHAERVAISKIAPDGLERATLFTTLEPCVEIFDEQIGSCSDLIVDSGISEVVVGLLDSNGAIYGQGYAKLLDKGIKVRFFPKKIREKIRDETFKLGPVTKIVGSGKRRVPVVESGIEMTLQFSETDPRSINFRWSTLQFGHGIVDLHAENGAVTVASGAKRFSDITDPSVFDFPSHFARMNEGKIAIVQPARATFCGLIKLEKIEVNDITFSWQVRNTI